MMQYKFMMIETRTYSVVYTVEADTTDEAWAKACSGDTISEDYARCDTVIDREVFEEL